ncbi:MAG: branched-chain amino acid ABC transporter permease [Oligoflexales bacterium]|nr:branched-chain amino acid ABC transporter permease [Oligoflexales bacterium]
MALLNNFLTALGPTLFAMLNLMGVYVILALSLNMINGMGGMFSIGHAGFWAVGAYSAGALIIHSPLSAYPNLTFALAMIVAIVITAIAGLVLSVSCMRLSGDYLAIATLGFSIIVVNILYNMDYVGAATGMILPVSINRWFVWLMVLVTLVFYYRVKYSNFGRLVMALREDEIAAEALGISRLYYKTLIFALGAALAGMAGALYAGFATYLNPTGFEFDQSIKMLTMVVLGGLGSITGVTFAAMILTLMPELLRLVGFEDYQMVLFALILLLMVLMRPQGILGSKEIWDIPLFSWLAPRTYINKSLSAAQNKELP